MGQTFSSSSSSSSGSDTSYKVLSIPAHTGKIRPKASSFPESALKSLKENEEYKSIAELFQFPDTDAYNANLYQFNFDSVGAPLAFFVPTTEEQISTFFRFYSSDSSLNSFSISIAAGRHSNLATLTDALVIDMKLFNKTDVRKEERFGYFGGGLKLGEVDAACYKEGLATSAGTNPDTGLAGLCLSGGFGFLARKHGMTCDNLIGARVVLPSGEIVAADENNEHKDLLWGLRGGGGNFGVVTEFTLRLHPQGQVLFGACVYILRSPSWFTIGHRAILQQWRSFTATAPKELCCLANFSGSGVLVLPYAYTGDDFAEGEKVVAPARKIGNPFIKPFGAAPYADHKKSLQWAALSDQQAGNYYEAGLILRELSDAAIDIFIKYTSAPLSPNSVSHIVLAQLGGRINEFTEESSPFPGRNAVFWINVLGRWESTANEEEYKSRREQVKKWVKDVSKELKPWLLTGTYNTLSSEEAEAKEGKKEEKKEEQVGELVVDEKLSSVPFLGGAVRKRLVQLKRKYDPKNVLRNNKNIDPNENI